MAYNSLVTIYAQGNSAWYNNIQFNLDGSYNNFVGDISSFNCRGKSI
jgi:hypothetical protein